jgi:hypothetical protein
LLPHESWIASRSLSSGAHSRDPLAPTRWLARTADYAFGTNPPYGPIQHRHYAARKEAKRDIFEAVPGVLI